MLSSVKNIQILTLTVVFTMVINALFGGTPKNQIVDSDTEIAVKWAKITLKTIKGTPNGSPTYASRCLGYLGLTMYESVVKGSPNHRSMEGQLKGLSGLPKAEKGKKYNWVLAMNAAESFMLKRLFEHTNQANINSIDSLETAIYQTQLSKTKQDVAQRSAEFGVEVAKAIFEWSKLDGGHEGYKRNFDSTYKYPVGDGFWKAPAKGQSPVPLPLHPHWGKNRTFSPLNQELPIPKMIAYDFKADSPYYAQMLEVYKKRESLTQEEKEIANWWGDDPSDTFSPPGHSYNLATIAIQTAKPNLFKATETYAKVGMAVADSFINCWKTKYTYHAERPFFFIFYNISTMWDLYWPEPPFPAFYSGHAGQGAAMAVVLTELYGENFKFVDNSHVGRHRDTERLVDYKERKFNSFWDAANECANSRLYGGIHTRQDNEVGTAEGIKIGKNVNSLTWKK
ncbi:MAG: vanadium-dependent haloperoxidase [Spirosomataceae bacterium]